MKTTLARTISALLISLFLAGTSSLPAQDADNATPAAQGVNEKAADEAQPKEDAAATDESQDGQKRRRMRPPIVQFGGTVILRSNEVVEAIVVIGGSAKVYGKVNEAVVVIGGDAEISGEVQDSAVVVLGGLKLLPGAIVHQQAVDVGGDFNIGSKATVDGEVVSVGGELNVEDGAEIKGNTQHIPVPMLRGLSNWFKYCVLRLRPLAPQVGFVWVITLIFFLLYLGITVLFPRAVGACVGNLTQRPATTFFMGLLTKLLVPIVILLLLAIGIGVFVVPFVGIALLVGALFGKAAFAQFIGLRIGEQLKIGALATPLAAFLLGTVIIILLYMVPVLGLIVFGIISVWGLGAAVMATFSGMRREMPPKPVTPSPATATVPTAAGFAPSAAPQTLGVNVAPPPGESLGTVPPVVPGEPGTSTVIAGAASPAAGPYLDDALRYPRASFWERVGAAFLDIILVSILAGIASHAFGGPIMFFLLALAYFSALWTWRGTTVGGIVLNLKVVRADGQPMNLAVGLVRALAAAFSVVVFFLGFLWILWDKERQGWHDKIAGTAVVRLPRGVPLVVL